MTSLYVHYLILTGLIGIHCDILTVSKVSVRAGDSISIPCLYTQDYKDNVKLLCKKKKSSLTCNPEVTTEEPDSSGKFLISDDTSQGIFNVTINDVMDDGLYMCVVKRTFPPHISNVKREFKLSVSDAPKLYVDQQQFTAFEGGNVTVRCHYDDRNQRFEEWCRLVSVGNKTCLRDPGGSFGRTTVTIDAKVPKVFAVTMSGLKAESSGWYWCATKNFQIPVHLTVLELTPTSTTTTTTTTTATTARTTTTMSPSTTYHTETFETTAQLTSADPHTAEPTNTTINGTGGGNLQHEHRSSSLVTILSTTLVFLLLIVPAAFFGWKMIIKHKKHKSEGPDIALGSQFGSDTDVQYATIAHNQKAAVQQNSIPEDTVTYSAIVTNNSVQQMTEPAEGSVIYSTVHAEQNKG